MLIPLALQAVAALDRALEQEQRRAAEYTDMLQTLVAEGATPLVGLKRPGGPLVHGDAHRRRTLSGAELAADMHEEAAEGLAFTERLERLLVGGSAQR